jgi:Tol biopolymer transport system component
MPPPFARLLMPGLMVLSMTVLLPSARAQVILTAPLDVNSLVDAGQASLTATPWDIGQPRDVFDGNTDTLYRSANINPAQITVTLGAPQTFHHFRVLCAGGTTRWRIETAETEADLDAHAGSYFLLIDWTTSPNETWWTLTPAAPRSAHLIRLTANRLVGDNYVHIREWEIHTSVTVSSLVISPASYELFPTQTQQLVAFGAASTGGIIQLGSQVAWQSSLPGVAGVNASGLVTAGSVGDANVTATLGGLPPAAASIHVLDGAAQPGSAPVISKRFLGLSFDPTLRSQGGQRLNTYFGWGDPLPHIQAALNGLNNASHGQLDARLTSFINADVWPVKADGYIYTEPVYLAGQWHMPDGVDYQTICRDYDLARRVDSGEVDEVYLDGAPYFGYWESTMAGRGGYYCNSGPQDGVACSKIFVMMGGNYERWDTILHGDGHRGESIMSFVYGFWAIDQDRHLWERFTHNIGQSPQTPACGSVHYPPNGVAGYDYANPQTVQSTAIDWEQNFPFLTGQTGPVNAETWGAPYQFNYLSWWWGHMPHVGGRNFADGYNRLNNWWEYTYNFNAHAESGGEHWAGAAPPPAVLSPIAERMIVSPAGDEWAPRVNSSGRVVWQGFDGEDYEIYSANADGTGFVQITNNALSDEAPAINDAGQVVWQAFDGRSYDIYTARADGTGLRRITSNTSNEWHAAINSAGRIVWDHWDGRDYEIFSANFDGSGVTQLTSNNASSGKPRDDVWPRIADDGRVVWAGYDGTDWEIYSCMATGGSITQLTDNVWDDEYPQISRTGGHVVWQARVASGNTEVFAASATGGPVVRLTSNSREDWWPQVNSAGTVVWMGHDGTGGGDWEIMRGSVTGVPGPVAVTSNFTHDQYPRIDEVGRIVWQGFDGGDWEIYSLDAAPGAPIQRLSDNSYDDRWPAISPTGGFVVWHAESTLTGAGRLTDIHVHAPGGGCAADFNHDGSLNSQDFFDFLSAFFAVPTPPGADFNHDGAVNSQDFFDFLGAFFAGCG